MANKILDRKSANKLWAKERPNKMCDRKKENVGS